MAAHMTEVSEFVLNSDQTSQHRCNTLWILWMTKRVQVIFLRQQAIFKQLLDLELRWRVVSECGADTPVFTPNCYHNDIVSLITIMEKYLKKERWIQWLRAQQGDQEDFNCFYHWVLAFGRESEAHTFYETTGNIKVLCADSFRWELRLKGRALILENMHHLADDNRRAEIEEQGMNALRDEHVRAIQRGGSRAPQMSQSRNQTFARPKYNRSGKQLHPTSECTYHSSVKCNKCSKQKQQIRQPNTGCAWQVVLADQTDSPPSAQAVSNVHMPGPTRPNRDRSRRPSPVLLSISRYLIIGSSSTLAYFVGIVQVPACAFKKFCIS